MSYQQLNAEERLQLYHLRQTTNLSIRGIAEKMGRSHTTISRELKRNQHPELESYLPDTAQTQAVERCQQAKLPFLKFTPNVIEEVSVKVERLSQPGTNSRSSPTRREANGEPRDHLSDDLLLSIGEWASTPKICASLTVKGSVAVSNSQNGE